MDAETLHKVYEDLGFQHGYAFAMTPFAYLAKAETILVGLNPGGSDGTHEDACWENLDGNAYFTGRWQADGGAEPTTVQTQVRALHALLGLEADEVFAAQFIPFRSASYAELPHKEQAVAFARQLWRWLLPQTRARRFVCMGMEAAWYVADLLQSGMAPEMIPSGWGVVSIRRSVTDDGRVVVGLPHPSWYQLIGTGDDITRARREGAVLHAVAEAGPSAV